MKGPRAEPLRTSAASATLRVTHPIAASHQTISGNVFFASAHNTLTPQPKVPAADPKARAQERYRTQRIIPFDGSDGERGRHRAPIPFVAEHIKRANIMTRHPKMKRPSDADLRNNPMIGSSKGVTMAGATPEDLEELQGVHTIEGDLENDVNMAGGIDKSEARAGARPSRR